MGPLPGKAKAIKTIFFDIGGVLLNIHPDRSLKYWADRTGMTLKQIKAVFPLEAHYTYEKGLLSDREFFRAFQDVLPAACSLTEPEFWQGWKMLLGKESPAVHFLKKLSLSCPIWLLSNTNPRHIHDELDIHVSFLKYVTGAVYSFEAGHRKPEDEIFEYALKKAESRADESLFIDDVEVNVEAARELGFHTIHYRGTKSLIKGLEALGIQKTIAEIAGPVHG